MNNSKSSVPRRNWQPYPQSPATMKEESKVEPVSDYGRKDDAEGFAEVFAEYVLGNQDNLNRDQAESFRAVMNLHKKVISNKIDNLIKFLRRNYYALIFILI